MNGCPSTSSGRTDFVAVIFLQVLIPLRFQDGTNPRPVGQLSGC
jgi:hypothetical protein